jgi:choline dehydrogenase-like flavoprotein
MDRFAQRWLHDTVSALVYSLAQTHTGDTQPELEPPYNDLCRFVLDQQARMPDYLRVPMKAATLVFDLLGTLPAGGFFHSRPPAIRSNRIAAGKRSRLAFQRDLVRYYESLATLALYSRGPEHEAPIVFPAPNHVVTEPAHDLRCEIAVVGSGPGGAITACLLAEAGRDVLLIEEGPFYPLDSCPPFSQQEMVQKYRNGGQTVAFGKNKVAYVEGRCVGGGSEINSGLYHRTPAEILGRWREEFQVENLAEHDLLPHFEACEKELSVSLLPGRAPIAALKLHEGATRLGWRSLEVPRWFRYAGGSRDGGTRQSMTQTFVPRFLQAGGKLLPQTRVDQIRQEAGKWMLTGQHGGAKQVRIQAEKLFLCCGAVQTPTLLRRSGITQNIGNSLRMHPTVKVVAKFREEVSPPDMGVPTHQVKEFAPRLSFGCSISSPPYVALGLIDHPTGLREATQAPRHLANYYAMITGQGSGTVRLVPGFRDPLVRYTVTANDRRDLADGVRKLAEILLASEATVLYPGVTGCKPLLSKNDLSNLPEILPDGAGNLMTIHLFSSCPMGEDKTKCATDSFGRVHGFANLFIADASLLCSAPGVNPQGSIMALARRNIMRFLSIK